MSSKGQHLTDSGATPPWIEFARRARSPESVKRGLPPELAGKVAEALTASDALGAHARDELGMAAIKARPVQAALYSALSFTVGVGRLVGGIST